jgi:hypothetical protein
MAGVGGMQQNGGEWASIRYHQGTLIVRAPDFVHRQIGGYPFALRPRPSSVRQMVDRRYVTFTGGFSQVEVTSLTPTSVGGAVGDP